jgi:hypothetical protein
MARFRDQRKGPYDGDVLGMAKHIALQMQTAMTDPDSDWPMTLFYLDAQGKGHVTTIRVASVGLRDMSIQTILNQARATEAVLMSNAWGYRLAPGAEIVPAAEAPGRREVLHLAHVGEDFVAFHQAEVRRTDDAPPTLGEFSTEEQEFADGRLTDALRRGISG